MPFSRSPQATPAASAAALAALLLASAGKHFRDPGFYDQVVPDILCRDDDGGQPNGPLAVLSRAEWVAMSGLLEAGAAAGLLVPATRRASAGCVALMFTLFLAGHAGALRKAWGPDGTGVQRAVHTVRLLLQGPLIAWAWSLRTGKSDAGKSVTGKSAPGPRT